MKRLITASVLTLTSVVIAVGFFVTLETTVEPQVKGTETVSISAPVDSLIKASTTAIYYYATDGNRYVFPNERTFGSWFSDYSEIITITNEELAQIPLKGNVTYRPGIRMVKIQTSPKVYVVDQGGRLRWIRTEELAERLYGSDWNKLIDDLPDVFFVNYIEDGSTINDIDDYNPHLIHSAVQTINKDKNIAETENTPRSRTIVGGSTIPAQPAQPTQPTAASTQPTIPAVPAFPAQTSATTTQPVLPADPAIPAQPTATTTETTIPATPATSAQPATPTQPTPDPTPEDSTPTPTTTEPVIDTTPPVISNIQATDITATAATISWTSDEFADSKVSYISTSTIVIFDSSQTTNHSINLLGLTSETIYSYVVVSTDASGNMATSSQQSFTTAAPASGSVIAWHDKRDGGEPEIYYAVEDGSGQKIVGDTRLTYTSSLLSYYPLVVSNNNDEFAVVWEEYPRTNQSAGCSIGFARINNIGTLLGSIVTITSDSYGTCPAQISMVWNGTGYALVWQENRSGTETVQIYFKKIDASGQAVTADVKLTQATGSRGIPVIVWTGTEYEVTWQDNRDTYGEQYSVKVDSDGNKIGSEGVVLGAFDIAINPLNL